MPVVTGTYEWGPWVNGGAWIQTSAGKVDFLYKNLDQVRTRNRGRMARHMAPRLRPATAVRLPEYRVAAPSPIRGVSTMPRVA
jgi:hypothetical protein